MAAKSHEFEVVLLPEEEGGFSVSVPTSNGGGLTQDVS